MPDTTVAETTTRNRFVDDYERRTRLRVIEILNERTALKQLLGSLGVTTVTAAYDGYGDSGNVTDIDLKGNDPAKRQDPDGLEERLKDFFWSVAYGQHPGFEINAGANGEIRWNVPDDKMGMEHHSRIEDVAHFQARDLYSDIPEHLVKDPEFKDLMARRDSLRQDLSTLGINVVTATYDGYGDSGNVKHLAVTPDNVELGVKFRERLSDFCWDVAYTEHPGLEIDAGGQGELKWNLQENRIDLDHQANFEDSEFIPDDDVGRSQINEVRNNPDMFHVHPVTGKITLVENETPQNESPIHGTSSDGADGPSP